MLYTPQTDQDPCYVEMKAIWLTDIHLNFLDDRGRGDFIQKTADETILPNLRVIAGGAEYGQPRIQRVFELR